MKPGLLIALAALLALDAAAAERWRLRYAYEGVGSDFQITSFVFPSARRGIAAGALTKGNKGKPYAVATSDGGETWQPLAIPAVPVSMFFLDEKAGWLVADDTIWRSADSGSTWKKAARVPGTLRVYFADARTGWAVGTNKGIRTTTDGGDTWKDVPAAAEPKTTPQYTVYRAIAFADGKQGVICGGSRPPRKNEPRSQVPEWMDPSEQRREWPATGIVLGTVDGGATWKAAEVSMFGQITNVSLAPDGRGLALVEFFDKFDYPSEVYLLDWKTGKSTRVFRKMDRAITDVLLRRDGAAYLASFQPAGSLFHSPVPGKLKMLHSTDLENWQEMDVDYRAVARQAFLASPSDGRLAVATDTGMILQLLAE